MEVYEKILYNVQRKRTDPIEGLLQNINVIFKIAMDDICNIGFNEPK